MRLSQLMLVNGLVLLPVLAFQFEPTEQPAAFNDLARAADLERQGRNREALPILLDIVHRLEPDPEKSPVVLGVALNDLATVSQFEGRFDEAEGRYMRAIHVLETHRGSAAARAAWAYTKFNLGRLYLESGRRGKAEGLSLASAIDAMPDPESRIRAECTLAGMAAMRSDFATAEEIYLRILSFWRDPSRVANSGMEIASVLNNLAVVAVWRGHQEKARGLIEQSLSLWSQLDPGNEPSAARVMATTGVVCTLLKQYDHAAAMLARATALGRHRYGESNPLTIAIELSFAEALNKAGRKSEAKEIARIAEEGRKGLKASFGQNTVDYRDLMSLNLKSGR
jgi:tetratricopeptide (TPR) repeat protein